jgi:hypothetical protein
MAMKMAEVSTLVVLLHGERIATLTLAPGDHILLTFDQR